MFTIENVIVLAIVLTVVLLIGLFIFGYVLSNLIISEGRRNKTTSEFYTTR